MTKKLKKSTKQLAKEVAKVSKEPVEKESSYIDVDNLIPSGSNLLNLACSDSHRGAYGLGKIVNSIGDSSTGKTYFALSTLAEAAMIKRFKDYRLIFDDAESANEFDIKKLFGKKLKKRIETDIISDTIEDYYGNLLKAIKDGRPFIYILDSLDSVTSIAEQKRAEDYAKGEIPDGSYKTEKPRMVSELLRVVSGDIKQKEALVIIISQTRDNIGFGAQFQPKVRTGGKALKFYSCHEMWHAVKSREKKKGIEIGAVIETRLTKNKLTGKRRVVETPIYPTSYGIDSITGNVNYLLVNDYWKKNKQSVVAKEFKIEAPIKRLVVEIENKGMENELDLLVADVWHDIEESLLLDRKPKY